MPSRDIYHHAVKSALQKDGWTITHDLGRVVREDYALAILVFDPVAEVIRQWLR